MRRGQRISAPTRPAARAAVAAAADRRPRAGSAGRLVGQVRQARCASRLPPDAPAPGGGCGQTGQASTRRPAAPTCASRPPEAGPWPPAAGGGGGGQAQMNAVSCPCTKCQSRYGGNSNQTDSSNDLLFSLDTTTAMQGVLTDGIALCCTM
ncbi:Uncharacterized protein GBIM_07123 [Gryllus bimaculatus]|nr:Uncharacterized protein GBIM_07123 [Gryllus bimaculatus]